MEILFIQLSCDLNKKKEPYDWFYGPVSHMTTKQFYLKALFEIGEIFLSL